MEIVNLTQEEDVLKVLTKVRNKQRVALDLDEVVLASGDCPTEKPPRFLWNRLYPERIRLGIPSLFWTLQKLKCDVWVYSSQLLSDDHIRYLFHRYHIHGVHVITGINRKSDQRKTLSGIEKKVFEKYPVTWHIDLKTVLKVNGATREFQEFNLPGNAVWSAEVLDIFRKQGTIYD